MRVSFLTLALVLAAACLATTGAQAAGDAKNGETVFGRCAICHNVKNGGSNSIGPNLVGVVGRKSASVPGFAYSSALKATGITWTDDKLIQWVTNPNRVAPGTKMAFPGITSKKEQADVVAYLHTLK